MIDNYKDLNVEELRKLTKEELIGILFDVYMEIGAIRGELKREIERFVYDKNKEKIENLR